MYICRSRYPITTKVKVILKRTLTLLLLVFSVYLLYYVMMTSSWMLPSLYSLRSPDARTQREFPSAVFKFYRKCRSLKINLFALDTNILSLVTGKSPHVPLDRVTMVSFGVFEDQGRQLEQIERSGTFDEVEFVDQKPTSGHPADNKHMSCFLFRFRATSLTLRILVVYKNDGFYSTDICGARDKNQKYGTIMEIFRPREVTVNDTPMLVPDMTFPFSAALPFSTYLACQRSASLPALSADQKTYLQAVLHVKGIARNLGKSLFLFSGSLLGWYRDCAFADVIYDVSLAMFVDDFDKRFHTALQKDPYIEGQVLGKISDGMQYHLKVNGTRIDLSLVYKDAMMGMTWTQHFDTVSLKQYRLIYPQFSVCSGLFYDNVIHVPCPVEPLLDFEFGKEWIYVADTWHREASPHNVQKDALLVPPWAPPLTRDLNDPTVV